MKKLSKQNLSHLELKVEIENKIKIINAIKASPDLLDAIMDNHITWRSDGPFCQLIEVNGMFLLFNQDTLVCKSWTLDGIKHALSKREQVSNQ